MPQSHTVIPVHVGFNGCSRWSKYPQPGRQHSINRFVPDHPKMVGSSNETAVTTALSINLANAALVLARHFGDTGVVGTVP